MLLLEQQFAFQSEWTSDLMSIDNYVNVTLSCKKKKDLSYANYVHTKISEIGLDAHMVVGNFIVPMFVECENIYKAQMVFNRLEHKKEHSWTSLIQGFVSSNEPQEAIYLFQKMQEDLVAPSRHTLVALIKASSKLRWVDIGQGLNTMVAMGNYENDIFIGNALIDMYAKCGFLTDAKHIFFEMNDVNVVTWTVMVAAYAEQDGVIALELFNKMQGHNFLKPNIVVFSSVLKACGSIKATEKGTAIYAEIIRAVPIMETNVLVGAALINMYSKCDAIIKAQEIFDRLAFRNVVSWNALIAGYVQNELGEEALKCFECMRYEGIHPNSVTFLSVTKACSIMGAAGKGIEVHKEIIREGLSETGRLGNALVDMYAKCGLLPKASEVFEKLNVRDVVAWTSLISGYAQLGNGDIVVTLFDSMIREEVKPSLVTFTVVLNACSHGGLLKEGEKLFDDMCGVYKLNPTLEHYTCMIDLFSRAGHFHKIKNLFDNLSSSLDHLPLYLAILGACKKWVNVELGRWAFEQSLKLDVKCASAYVGMRNIYSESGMQIESDKVEALRVQNEAW